MYPIQRMCSPQKPHRIMSEQKGKIASTVPSDPGGDSDFTESSKIGPETATLGLAPRIDEYQTCGSRMRIVTEGGSEWLLCTLPLNHPGKHYDVVFHMEWSV